VQLQQVIMNLVRNSIEAMASAPGKPRVLKVVSGVDREGRVEVSVIDSGPGLDPAVDGRLFEAFVTTKTAGLGMGLSVCRSIVMAHSGQLFGSNNDGRGSTFKFIIPPSQGGTESFPPGPR
jgi:signal transduction histidine kinase